MRLGLRWKILVLAVVTPLGLGLATYVTVHRNVTAHVNSSSIHESLEHSVQVFESTLRMRSRALSGGARVVVQDPRFFSLLTLGVSQRDAHFQATVRGMAADYDRITQTDLFEVFDAHGRLLASAGAAASTPDARAPLVRGALRGEQVEGVLVGHGSHFQVAATPILADHRIVGVLLSGSEISGALAREMRQQMRCEVTFLSDGTVTGTTLTQAGDRDALMRAVQAQKIEPGTDLSNRPVANVHGPHEDWLTLIRRLPGSDPATSQLYVMQKSFDPETTFLSIMKRDMTRLALLALVAALITGWLFSNQVLRPVQALVRGAQAMEAGDYEHPVPVGRNDELGYLATRFVEMRRREREYVGSLEQAAKLKSEFLSIASSELRTPISVLDGFCEILAEEQLGPLTPRQRHVLDSMRGHLQRLTRVAEKAAQLAQLQGERMQLERAECGIDSLLRRAVAIAGLQAEGRKVDVTVTCEPGVGEAWVDGGQLEKALTHLVVNALRHTPDGGRIDVRALASDDALCIEVADTGAGIDQGRLAQLLGGTGGTPTAAPIADEAESTGMGLGLPFVRSVAEAHGGTLSASSRVGEGSVFTLDLPIAPAEEQRAAA